MVTFGYTASSCSQQALQSILLLVSGMHSKWQLLINQRYPVIANIPATPQWWHNRSSKLILSVLLPLRLKGQTHFYQHWTWPAYFKRNRMLVCLFQKQLKMSEMGPTVLFLCLLTLPELWYLQTWGWRRLIRNVSVFNSLQILSLVKVCPHLLDDTFFFLFPWPVLTFREWWGPFLGRDEDGMVRWSIYPFT